MNASSLVWVELRRIFLFPLLIGILPLIFLLMLGLHFFFEMEPVKITIGYPPGITTLRSATITLTRGAIIRPKEFDEFKESRVKADQVLDILNENKGDVAELVRLFTGGKTDLEQWRQAKNAEEEAIATMSPDELAAYQRQINDRQKDTEIAKLQSDIESMKQAGTTSSAEAEESRRNDLMSSTFSRYMFRGKMEDQVNAETMDEMMWHSFHKAMKDNHDVWTPEAADLEMKMIHDRVSRAFGRSVEKKVEQVVAKRRTVAENKIAKEIAPAKRRSSENISADIKENGIMGMISKLGNYEF